MSVTVYNNIEKVAGDPQISVTVTIELIWDTDLSSVAKVDDDETMIHGQYTFSGDDNGYWEKSLVPNDVISPADSVYRITEITSDGTSFTYYVSITDSSTPTQWVGDLTVARPDWLV